MIREVWDEIWTKDNGGHLALWLILCALIWFLPKTAAALFIPTLWLFNREKLQWNCDIGDWDFRLGWPWQLPKWSMHKWFEFAVPSIAGAIICMILIVTL